MNDHKYASKPEGSTWTDDQWKAIVASGSDILVAAAAGSGKTAVLVERIIRKILSGIAPMNVDEMLIVTFTNASAAEMRHRISLALEKEIDLHPDSSHLRKQLSLLNRASISTLHSFCLEVIRKYYYRINMDPSFRLANETEAELIRDEVLDDLFEEQYGLEKNEEFYHLVDTFSTDRSDVALQSMIRKLHDFSRSHPNPGAWLDNLVHTYEVNEEAQIEELDFMGPLLFDIRLTLEQVKNRFEEAYDLTLIPGGPTPRAVTYANDLEIIDRILESFSFSWEMLYKEMQSYKFMNLKVVKGDQYDKQIVDESKDKRDEGKKMLEGIKEEYFSHSPSKYLKDMIEMKPVIVTLIKLVKEFGQKYKEVKEEKGLADFSDLEHYCLEVLSNGRNEDGSWIPSEAALDYQLTFKEVLVDEYQDTNMVQESIIQLVTVGEGENGNLFMVGDVKQSIYRFRLAEPNLFLKKYRTFTNEGDHTGMKIDLSKNFRSRSEILDATNFLFKQIMGTNVGEMEYDQQAELVKGAPYPEEDYPVEWILIDLEEEAKEESEEEADQAFNKEDLAQSIVESRQMARTIREMIDSRKPVYDPKTKIARPIQYKDIVILLRSMTWAPEIMEEFKRAGIPIYANISTGYFEATEVAIMLSLLNVIDNPLQDIPLASVLRSPIVGLTEEELAQIRIASKSGQFYEALQEYVISASNQEALYQKVTSFIAQLTKWRSLARQGSLAELIWQLYRDTKFYDFIGGLPGGKQRQANLRALYDRARQYEATSFRGLFRFLRFVERMRERGDDLGAARTLSEQEDVVRMMTVHSSKGLEFPIVFVAGISRNFNMMDLNKAFMLDKDSGIAVKYTNVEKRISYPSLPQLAMKRKKKLELIAEEMRVLYVALTRAKEKLYLVSSVKGLEKKLEKWKKSSTLPSTLLKDYDRAQARSYLDWIGPALFRHDNIHTVLSQDSAEQPLKELFDHPSKWALHLIHKHQLWEEPMEMAEQVLDWKKSLQEGVDIPQKSVYFDEIQKRLSWEYSYQKATERRSKQSVSELKKWFEGSGEEGTALPISSIQKPIFDRPRFMREKSLTPAERGTALHLVMQHVSLEILPTKDSIEALLEDMFKKELLTIEQKECIQVDQILAFFQSEIGDRVLKAEKVQREVPFSLAIPVEDLNMTNIEEESLEPILIQGVMDCVFSDEKGTVLLDYKTDRIYDRFKGGFEEGQPVLARRYRVQMDLYSRALEQIFKVPVEEKYLFFLDGGHLLKM
jgi:ATP-dependent helicase/nuclease subunit A